MAKKITKIEPVKQKQTEQYTKIKRVCAYCRVSTASAEQKHSFDAQMQYYTRMIGEKPDWILVGIYADEARSGTKVKHRDGFQQMIQECKRGNIDLIMTKSVTRFARNTIDSIHTIRMLKELGVEVYFEKERMSTLSQKSEQLLTILSSIAQGESESISTNSRWAIKRRFQNGIYTIASPAYGYQNDEHGNLIIQPEEAMIVRRIFDAYLGGKGSYTIAKELQAEGVPTIRKAKSWQDCVVKEILQNPVYEGDMLYQKIYIGKPYEKIQWSCCQHIKDITKCRQKPIREDVIQQAFIKMWNKLTECYEDILLPLLAVLKAVPNDVQQEQELLELENRIQELKQQSHWLQKVLVDGDIGSAVFIEKRNHLDTELEQVSRRYQILKEQNLMEKEIAQTEYLLTVFRTRNAMIDHFDEELFRLIVEQIIVYPDKLCFRLKNDLEFEESYRKEV